MAITVSSKGISNCKGLIKAGKVDETSAWSFSADDGNAILGKDNWAEYGRWHMAVDDSAAADTKDHYKYPFGKGGKVYRSALRAIRSRSAQQNQTDVFDAAGICMDMMDAGKKSFDNAERRFVPATELRVITNDDGSRKITGLAAVFNKNSVNLGGFIERIEPGAFKDALKSSDTRALFNHDSNFILGRKSAGTLRLKETTDGLSVEIDPPNTQIINDLVMAPIERGDIQGMSFGFRLAPNGDSWEETDDGRTIRTLNNFAEISDVSPVVFPAYPDTKIALRSLQEWEQDHAPNTSAIADGKEETYAVPMQCVDILKKRAELKHKTQEVI